MILGTDANGNVLLLVDGTDPSKMPTEFNGAALVANVLTDIQEAAYLALPVSRAGETFIAGTLTVLPLPAPISQPDPQGFAQAMKAGVGQAVANALMKSYPLFYGALKDTPPDWNDVQWAILDAKASGVINSTQYAQFQEAVIAFRIPVVLP